MRIWLATTMLCVPAVASAQTLPAPPATEPAAARSAQGDVAVTIYTNNLALIQDTRQLMLPRGRSAQEFADVSAAIRPETVTLTAVGTTVVEQNFDYDLLSPAKLMDKAVGQTVTVVRTNPATGAETREAARVLANNGGTVVQIGNRIEVLDRNAGRVIFPTLPPNLRARPTLSVTLDSSSAGPRPATLNYLSQGLGWSADYVALFDEKAGKLDVQGWITLSNTSGTTFVAARTLLVAGSVGGNPGYPTPRGYQRPTGPRGNQPGTETAGREQLGDFYLYPLAERTTIANAQTKQVSFLDVAGTPAAKSYFYRNAWLATQQDARSVDTVLKFSASRDGGLGDALPAGTVRVYMRDARGAPQFIGESAIAHTPMGSRLALKTGEAFDVKILPVVEKRERASDTRWRTTMRYTLTNARASEAEVELVQAGLEWWRNDTRIVEETQPSERANADETVWRVRVPANGSASVTATFETRY